jgi:ATPase subunit of ABC transporter with duplicated ATPase domains
LHEGYLHLTSLLQAVDLDVVLLDKKIDQMMPELGFKQEDNDQLVASFSGGWQMRMCLGKMLLQVPLSGTSS